MIKINCDIVRDDDLNLVQQLKINKYADTLRLEYNLWRTKYRKEGILLIGAVVQQKKNLIKNIILILFPFIKETYDIWSIQFDKIYFLINVQITVFMKFNFKHDSGIIKGISSYEKLIKIYNYDSLISSN